MLYALTRNVQIDEIFAREGVLRSGSVFVESEIYVIFDSKKFVQAEFFTN
jgi:hypothetical protein